MQALKGRRPAVLTALAAAALLSLFFIRELYYISYSSPTFDEGQYTAYGYSLLKTGDWRLANYKPDLVPLLSALPLLAAGARLDTENGHWKALDGKIDSSNVWLCTLEFLHNNVLTADQLLFYARLPIIFLAILLGLAVYDWSARLFGKTAGLLSLALYTTCPNILAHGGLVTEDMASSVFSFLTVYFYYLYNRTKNRPALLLAGTALGLALNTKYTGVLLFPALAGYCLFEYFLSPGGAGGGFKRRLLALCAVFAAALVVLLSFYGVFSIGHYLAGMRNTAVHIEGGQMAFLNGKYSVNGFWNYFIYAILLKTALPVLICAGLAAAAKLRERSFFDLDGVYLMFFPALLLLTASFSNFHIGLRHILPVYPFLFVFCGGALKFLKGKASVFVPAALLFWQILASAGVHPYYLTYFNELAGGPAGGDEHLLDSNLDWGQDLKGLKRYLDSEKVSDLVLSYYGSSLPVYVGRDYQDLFSTIAEKDGHVNRLLPSKEYLAVSATNLHGVYFREFGKDMFYWLKGVRPKTVIGNNIRVYDITSDARAHEHLANVYFLTGYPAQAERECSRALLLAPRSRMAGFLLALVRLKERTSERAGLELLKKRLRENGYSAPAALPEFTPAPLFRYRYFLISQYAAQKFRETNDLREAAAMSKLAERIKGTRRL